MYNLKLQFVRKLVYWLSNKDSSRVLNLKKHDSNGKYKEIKNKITGKINTPVTVRRFIFLFFLIRNIATIITPSININNNSLNKRYIISFHPFHIKLFILRWRKVMYNLCSSSWASRDNCSNYYCNSYSHGWRN